MKILNLYAGIGGNRKLWEGHDVVAVELDESIAFVYQDLYPKDFVVVEDAHRFLLNHFQDFDFIWSSPPCPSHGQYRYNVGVKAKGYKPVYPDMKLYEEIILLQYYFDGKYVVENTIGYYEPLISPQKISRHYFWANFVISSIDLPPTGIRDKNKIKSLEDFLEIDLSPYKLSNKRQILRNCTNPVLGKHVLNCAIY